MRKLSSFTDQLNQWVLNLLAIVFGIVSLITLFQVFSRYILGTPLGWSEAVVRYLVIWVVLLGTAVAMRKGLLISVEALHFILPEKVTLVMKFLIVLINITFLVLLLIFGFDIMENLMDTSSGALQVSVSWFYAAIPVGALLALFNSIVILLELIFTKERGEESGSPTLH